MAPDGGVIVVLGSSSISNLNPGPDQGCHGYLESQWTSIKWEGKYSLLFHLLFAFPLVKGALYSFGE